jgi:putative transposase
MKIARPPGGTPEDHPERGGPRALDTNYDDDEVSQNTVAALMRELGLAARRKNKRKATTRPGRGRWRAPDLVKRDFPAGKINCKWYGDGTEIGTDEGKLHLASVLDMASRRVLGFALSGHHDAALAYGALAMAVAVRGGRVPGVILHADSERIHRPRLPGSLPAGRHLPADGPARVVPVDRLIALVS